MTAQDETLLKAVRAASTDDGRTFCAATMRIIVGIVDKQTSDLARIKAALMAAGCSDYTDDVARMAEEYLAQPEEG